MTRLTLSIAAMALLTGATVQPALAAVPAGTPVIAVFAAQSYLDVISMLEETGYRVTNMKSTLLGRLKIQAQNREHVREVVVSRSTGEIKSDRILRIFASEGGSSGRPGVKTPASGSPSATASGGGVSASVGSGGVNANVGGASASVGSGGVNASVGGVSVGLGN